VCQFLIMELRGSDLISALLATARPLIQVRGERHLLGMVPRPVALAMARTGDYFGIGSRGRVRHLRQTTDHSRRFPLDSEFWRGRGVVRHWPDQKSKFSSVALPVDGAYCISQNEVPEFEPFPIGAIHHENRSAPISAPLEPAVRFYVKRNPALPWSRENSRPVF
jgi:hypothetical protein